MATGQDSGDDGPSSRALMLHAPASMHRGRWSGTPASSPREEQPLIQSARARRAPSPGAQEVAPQAAPAPNGAASAAPAATAAPATTPSAPAARAPSSPPPPVDKGELPVVQIASMVTLCMEDCGTAKVDVLRFGALHKPCSVAYYTEDVTAKAKLKYVPKSGTVNFSSGQEVATISIEVIQDNFFDTNLDFVVALKEPQDCVLKEIDSRSRVMIIDDDMFPTNDYKTEITSNTMTKVGNALLFAFIIFILRRVPDIRRRFILSALMDQLHNVNYLLQIYLQVYMVNTVFAVHDPESEERLWANWIPAYRGSRMVTVLLCAMCFMLPKAILTYTEYQQINSLGCAGAIKQHLSANLFRKFLYYSHKSREQVSVQALHTAMLDEVNQVAVNGFCILFKIFQQLGKSGMVLFFLVQKNPGSALPILIYPCAMVFFLKVRYGGALERKQSVQDAEVSTMVVFDTACAEVNMIKEYNQRSFTVLAFEDSVKAQLGPGKKLNLYEFTTEQIMPWITTVVVGTFMVYSGHLVLLPKENPWHVSLGVFLATLGIYKDAGELFGVFYLNIKNLRGSIGSLIKLIRLLNLETDVMDNLKAQTMRQRSTDQFLTQIPKPTANMGKADTGKGQHHASRYDELPLVLRNIALRHSHGGPTYPALQGVTLRVPQGKLVAILGPHGCGKSTLLRMLQGSVRPVTGEVYVPGHLHRLQVPHVPVLLDSGTLYENLTFGRSHPSQKRVISICKKLGFGDHFLDLMIREMAESSKPGFVKKSAKNTEWYESASHTELRMIHLARALVFNPEILCIHRPIDESESPDALRILELLRHYVDWRGLDFTTDEALTQRPHTVFLSSGQDQEKAEAASDIADVVWRMSPQGIDVRYNDTPHLPEDIDNRTSRIVKSWHREVQEKQDRVHTLETHLTNTEINRRQLESQQADLEAALEQAREEVHKVSAIGEQYQHLWQNETSRLCKVRLCGGDLF
eukprot:TRINITY_DN37747_c0_g1_i1.p1 TRINITY_DN37747_c0_g1~~TRINITY_DN37747_c0_g1_i1.p1  ORF type:complete len:973 (-),score=219.53 TRINITY_DN37747_c0_g1_i1:219-3137(-)